MAIGNALMQAGQQMANASSGNGNNYSFQGSSSGTSNTGSSSNVSSGNYQMQYNNWKKRAQSHYNSLTNLGIRVKVMTEKETEPAEEQVGYHLLIIRE